MDPVRRDRLKQAIDLIYHIEGKGLAALESVADFLDSVAADERTRAGRACEGVARELIEHDAAQFDSEEAEKLCRQLRAQAAESAMICAGRVDPATKRDLRNEIADYKGGWRK